MPLNLNSIPIERSLSPITGWTRDHWLHIAETLLAGYFNTVDSTTGMPLVRDRIALNPHLESTTLYGSGELFERHLILAASWLKGLGSESLSQTQSWKQDLVQSLRRAIIIGTTVGGKHEWKDLPPYSAFGNGLAMAIMIAPEHFWVPFSPEQQMNIGYFMKRLAEHSSHNNNHWYFHMAGVPIMDLCGIKYEESYFEEKWQRLMGWHRGDGWYIDGNNDTYDYYNHWGFHYFNLLLYCGSPKWAHRYGDHIRKVTTEFLKSYPLFFGSDGASVPWGRSLIYRHALLAPLVWAEYAGISPLNPGLSRRIASGNLKYFFKDGTSLPEQNILAQGFKETNFNLLETYNDQGSAYWSSTAFIPLALPPEHPFWSSPEEPMSADKEQKQLKKIDGPKFLIQQQVGRARLFSFEQPRKAKIWQLGIKYNQQVYDSSIGFGLVGEKGEDPGFNRVGYCFKDSIWRYRYRPFCEELTEQFGISSWAVEGVENLGENELGRIYQCTFPGENMDIHLFYHTCPTPLTLSFAGSCISCIGFPCKTMEVDACSVQSERFFSAIRQIGVTKVSGKVECSTITPEFPEHASHLFGGTGVFPKWTSDSPIEANHVLIFACSDGFSLESKGGDGKLELQRVFDVLSSSAWSNFCR